MKEYTIQVQSTDKREYTIEAESNEEAIEIATDIFLSEDEELDNIEAKIVSVNEELEEPKENTED
jgi:hypothetical protein